ncbi:MAG: GNAT family N-acetyltransferase, partial [Lachnospiraceae bacterium]|nr:GNAT family N-acetyltransferase [Lachnospiraceae bacterium]
MTYETSVKDFIIRPAVEEDISFVLDMIHELAVYEHMEDQAIATADGIREAVFVKQNTGILIGEYQGEKVGYALYFTSFS